MLQQTNKDEDQARLFFILGIFVGILHVVNMCMYCGSPNPAVKRWANYSGIALGVQVGSPSSFALTACSQRSGQLQMVLVIGVVVADVVIFKNTMSAVSPVHSWDSYASALHLLLRVWTARSLKPEECPETSAPCLSLTV